MTSLPACGWASPHLVPPPRLIRSGGGRKSRQLGQLLPSSTGCPEHLSLWEPLPRRSLHRPRPPSGGDLGRCDAQPQGQTLPPGQALPVLQLRRVELCSLEPLELCALVSLPTDSGSPRRPTPTPPAQLGSSCLACSTAGGAKTERAHRPSFHQKTGVPSS